MNNFINNYQEEINSKNDREQFLREMEAIRAKIKEMGELDD